MTEQSSSILIVVDADARLRLSCPRCQNVRIFAALTPLAILEARRDGWQFAPDSPVRVSGCPRCLTVAEALR